MPEYAGGQLKVFGECVQNTADLLKALKGGAEGPVGLVLTNELPKVNFGLGFEHIKAGVSLSNGYVTSSHILPMPAPCTATSIPYVLASGVTGKFLGFEVEIARKAITEKQWHFQIPQDGRRTRTRADRRGIGRVAFYLPFSEEVSRFGHECSGAANSDGPA